MIVTLVFGRYGSTNDPEISCNYEKLSLSNTVLAGKLTKLFVHWSQQKHFKNLTSKIYQVLSFLQKICLTVITAK